ncbi:MAG: heavy-metal-associated domain-containing protein [Saprospiraceae bacterium]|nr:heavy-metal-associated domain-containing protein [Saprospiraceae bacterium]
MKEEVIVIQNLKCGGCMNTIAQILGAFPEIKDVQISLEDATVTILTEQESARPKYEEALTKAGYPPEGSDNPLHRVMKSYVSCAIGRLTPASTE